MHPSRFLRPLALCLAASAAAAPPAPNLPLHDTRWTLESLDGTPVRSAEGVPPAHMVLNAATQHVSGFAGCNRLNGRYTQRGTQIALTALATTRMACEPERMQHEQRLIELLVGVDAYRIEGRMLSLLQGEAVRVTFQALAER